MTALEQNLESLKKAPVVKAPEIKFTKADKDFLYKEIAEYKNCAELCRKKLDEIESYKDYLKGCIEYFENLAAEDKENLLIKFPKPDKINYGFFRVCFNESKKGRKKKKASKTKNQFTELLER